MNPSRFPRIIPVATALAVALATAGCVTTEAQRIGADDGSDVCRPQRAALDQTGDFFAEDMVKGALIGAIGGAIGGALLSRGNRGTGALIGAVVGAGAGAAGGYWVAKQRQEQNAQRLAASVGEDLSRENAQIDSTQLAFDQLVQCRRNEAARVRASLASGSISRPQAVTMMAGVRARYEEDIRLAQQISQKISERSTNFQFANDQLNPAPHRVRTTTPIRAEPGARAAIIGSLPAGRTVEAAREDDEWMRVTTEAGQGYVASSALTPVPTVAQPAPRPQQGRPAPPPRPTQTASRDPDRRRVATETSTNLAKRDQFQRSVQTAQSGASAFELS
ncbi:MAG: SH3 domain-containing protein [Alphaproteobacteria bacterium]